MTKQFLQLIQDHPNKLPPILVYIELLYCIERKEKITREEAMNKYRLYNCQQWKELLKI